MTTTGGDDAGRPTPAPIPAADDVFAALRDLVEDSVTPASDDADAAAVRVRAGALFARLRALNRSANATIRAHKQATADARLKLDHTHLGLQNLLYEKRHLVREIEKCRQFASVYQDIPLHPLEAFIELAPEAAKTPEVLEDEHQLMLNRLSFELAERQRLDQKKKTLVQQKEALLKESKLKQKNIDEAKKTIDAVSKHLIDAQKKIDDLVGPLSTLTPMQEDKPAASST